MNRLVNSMIAALVGLLVLVGSLTRFHHHDEDSKVCCCLLEMVSDQADHNHCDGDHRHSEGDSSSCPLHIDYFKVSEPLYKIDMHMCCHHLCDLCAPIVHYPEHEHTPVIYSRRPEFLPSSEGYQRCATHRGPPTQTFA